ncbi:biotin-dependent carboxyltransferase family protein [Asanoa sp. NPDC049573]|uniref:5-oxoprolinase subunit C family protein n=1 Tax=Asanoa sp. NPDC049573 TaxID=3155396 RepID=UPI0034388BF0
MSGVLAVVKAGALTTVQDFGRPGYAHLGVPRSGALDPGALRRANALVGNPAGAAGLETTLTGCAFRLPAGGLVALTGAVAAVSVDGVPAALDVAVRVPPDGLVEVGRATAGVRSYVAVAGGIAVPPVLGSRSTDTLSGLGPPRLRNGDLLPLGRPGDAATAAGSDRIPNGSDGPDPYGPDPHGPHGPGPHGPHGPHGPDPHGLHGPDTPEGADGPNGLEAGGRRLASSATPGRDGLIVLPVRLGPRDGWFTAAAVETLLTTAYTVSPNSNRVGARLAGAALARAVAGELPSEGVVLGAVQVPADGQPLIFLADHPTTGGYPVIAVVTDVSALAQARPGSTVRFHGPQR